MSILHPRTRLVNFRLSEEEFDKLKESCARLGARSISDFARNSVLKDINEPLPGGQRLHSKVAELEVQVGQVMNLLRATGQSTSPQVFQSVGLPLEAYEGGNS